jgi:hypothetical protein
MAGRVYKIYLVLRHRVSPARLLIAA